MFSLCSVKVSDLRVIFGDRGMIPGQPAVEPKYSNLHIIMIGQPVNGNDRYLMLTDTVVPEMTKLSSVPEEGYEFIFRQEWGLRITEELLHRTIDTLRKESYPPIADYVDGVVKGDDAQVQDYLQKCLAVKEKYPKFSW